MMGLTIILAAAATLAPVKAATRETGQSQAKKSALQRESGLDKITGELNRAGPIAVINLRNGSGILKGTILAERPEVKVAPVAPARPPKPAPRNLQDDPVLNEQYQGAFAAIEGCRVEAARRLHVPPAEVEVDTIKLRWTIEPSGQTRDMKAVAISGTDLTVVACAEFVLANWKLLSPVLKPVTVELTHSFRKLVPIAFELRER